MIVRESQQCGGAETSLRTELNWSLAKTLRVCIALFESDGDYCVLPSDEFDGGAATILFEYDPFAR